MADLFDTRGVPDDQQYWDSLAQRVASAAVVGAKPDFIDWLGNSRASWIAASVIASLVFGLIVAPARRDSAPPAPADWQNALAPADDIAREVIVSDTPPPIGRLLTRGAGEVSK
ncbi:MAG: hypothetical protein WD690_14040 [Vicinamibacterales bacterium]